MQTVKEHVLSPADASLIEEMTAQIERLTQQRIGAMTLLARQRGVGTGDYVEYGGGKLLVRSEIPNPDPDKG